MSNGAVRSPVVRSPWSVVRGPWPEFRDLHFTPMIFFHSLRTRDYATNYRHGPRTHGLRTTDYGLRTKDFSSQDLISAPFRCRYLSGLYGIDTPRVLASLN